MYALKVWVIMFLEVWSEVQKQYTRGRGTFLSKYFINIYDLYHIVEMVLNWCSIKIICKYLWDKVKFGKLDSFSRLWSSYMNRIFAGWLPQSSLLTKVWWASASFSWPWNAAIYIPEIPTKNVFTTNKSSFINACYIRWDKGYV